ncbi:hypothetical protein PR048_002832 [Dryococelus australis]|uniref:Uncharacterized protein n=1 Tax=Dryococelus australis TaxID=614101 RepID=A0ABQ9IL91_9NEOP|nr:hypothetical protein PR048_002832 [Dryococelus australis]
MIESNTLDGCTAKEQLSSLLGVPESEVTEVHTSRMRDRTLIHFPQLRADKSGREYILVRNGANTYNDVSLENNDEYAIASAEKHSGKIFAEYHIDNIYCGGSVENLTDATDEAEINTVAAGIQVLELTVCTAYTLVYATEHSMARHGPASVLFRLEHVCDCSRRSFTFQNKGDAVPCQSRSGERWAALNIEILRTNAGETSTEMEGRGKREIPEITRRPAASSDTILACENSGATPLGIKPDRDGSSVYDLQYDLQQAVAWKIAKPLDSNHLASIPSAQDCTNGSSRSKQYPVRQNIIRLASRMRLQHKDPGKFVGAWLATAKPRATGLLEF